MMGMGAFSLSHSNEVLHDLYRLCFFQMGHSRHLIIYYVLIKKQFLLNKKLCHIQIMGEGGLWVRQIVLTNIIYL